MGAKEEAEGGPLLLEPVFGLELLLVIVLLRVEDIVVSFDTPNRLIPAGSASYFFTPEKVLSFDPSGLATVWLVPLD
jgi:hypothetical protein